MDVIKNEQDRDRANFWLQFAVAGAVIVYNGVLLLVGSTLELTERQASIIQLMLGAGLAWMGAILSFCFPNSIGSQKTQDTINKLVEKTPPVTGEARESLENGNPGSEADTSDGSAGRGAGSAPIAPRQPVPGEYGPSPISAGTIPTQPPTVRVGEAVQPRS